MGLIDTRLSYVDGLTSHVDGGYGKFRFNPDGSLSLGQAVLNYQLDFDNPLSVHINSIAYADGLQDGLGLTEANIHYQGLPSNNGQRFSARLGVMYPKISLENNATGWTSPFTLTSSTLNSWLGEEVRHAGLEVNLDLLGKFHQGDYDIGFSATVFMITMPILEFLKMVNMLGRRVFII